MNRYFKYYFDVNQSKLFCTPTEDDELSPVLEPPTQSTEDLQNPLKAVSFPLLLFLWLIAFTSPHLVPMFSSHVHRPRRPWSGWLIMELRRKIWIWAELRTENQSLPKVSEWVLFENHSEFLGLQSRWPWEQVLWTVSLLSEKTHHPSLQLEPQGRRRKFIKLL